MDIPFSRWYPVISKRRSRRHFIPNRPIEPDKKSALDAICKQFKPFPNARSCLVTESVNKVFKGIIGSYGKVKNAPAFIAFIGSMDSNTLQEEVGYTGEGIILEATALGLNTCWVAGFFRPECVSSIIEIENNERVLAVTPIGYAAEAQSLEERLTTGFGLTHNRVPISKLIAGKEIDKIPGWVKASVEAARLAPSAINRQPWGFLVEDDGISVFVRTGGPEFNVSKRLDCGIAMLHIEVAALNYEIKGKWEFLRSPDVAKFWINLKALP